VYSIRFVFIVVPERSFVMPVALFAWSERNGGSGLRNWAVPLGYTVIRSYACISVDQAIAE
jgi:hypothetical protein